MKNKPFLITIVVIICLFSCFSCSDRKIKNREYNEEEVITAAEKLIKKSEKVNEIYYGHGISYYADESTANGIYYQADFLSLERFGVDTIDDIKALTYDCFTKSISEDMISTTLGSVSDEDGIQTMSRYYQKYNALDNKPECIMVNKNAIVYLTDNVVYDYSSIRVSRVEGDTVFVKIDVTVTTEEDKTQTQELEIGLFEESDGWRLNSSTYTKYVDKDYYNDLQNKK